MRVSKKIASILLAALMLVTTAGVTLHKHYCMGELKSVALFEKADSCNEGMPDMPCCEDEKDELKVKEASTSTQKYEKKETTEFSSPLLPLLLEILSITTITDYFSYNYYSPPLPDRDITILIQTFLI